MDVGADVLGGTGREDEADVGADVLGKAGRGDERDVDSKFDKLFVVDANW